MMKTVYHEPTPAFVVDAFNLHIAVLQDMGARLHASLELAHRALWPEMYAALDEAQLAVIDDRLFDCVSGDMHVLTPAEQREAEGGPIAELELAMLDTCLGAPHSEAEAGCLLVELEERGIYVRPALCADCGRTHLKAGW
jgi:hypothetical protein